MSWKSIAAGIVGLALLAGAAFAEPPAALSESSLQGNWRASKVVGLSVYNESNEKIGSINDLVMDKAVRSRRP
jgi:PRC-barrel domain